MFNYLGEVDGDKNNIAATEYETLEAVKGLFNFYYMGKSTYLANALPKVTEAFSISNRKASETPRILLVLTDGNLDEADNDLTQARNAIRNDPNHTIDEIFAIGVGTKYNEDVLKTQLATDIKEEDIHKTG